MMTMRADKKRKLEAKGWRVGSTAEFLRLSASDEGCIEIRLALANAPKQERIQK